MNAKTTGSFRVTRGSLMPVLKWLVAIVLLIFVFRSGKLSLTEMRQFLTNPAAAALAFGLAVLAALLSFWRWQTLLGALDLRMSYWTALRMSMMGQFFSAMIPGTVGGDFIKAVYLAKHFPLQKTRAVTTIFLDRVAGLAGMITLAGTAFLVGHQRLTTLHTPTAHLIMAFGWLLACIVLVMLTCLAIYPFIASKLPVDPPAFVLKLPASAAFYQLYKAIYDYRYKVHALWGALLIAVSGHILNASVLYVVAHTIFGGGPWGALTPASFVMGAIMGNATSAVPISPMGLGVGQVAFNTIFVALGAPFDNFGASIVTGYQMTALLIALIGGLFFVTYRHRAQEDAAELANAEGAVKGKAASIL